MAANAPARVHLGFVVDGAAISPPGPSLLTGDPQPLGAGSPAPVIIPPTFQAAQTNQLPLREGHGAVIQPSLQGPAAAATAGPRAPDAALPAAAESCAAPLTAVTPVAASEPKPILQPHLAEAAHAGLSRQETSNSLASDTPSNLSGASTTMFKHSEDLARIVSSPQPPSKSRHHAQHAQQQQQGQQPQLASTPHQGDRGVAASAAGAGGGKAMTKAERRELQERQRAAKAQAHPPPQGKGGGAVSRKESGTVTPTATAAGSTAGKADGRAAPKASQAGFEKAPSTHGGKELSRGASMTGAFASTTTDAAHAAHAAGATEPPRPKKQQGAKVVSVNSTELFAHLQQYRKVTVDRLVLSREAASMHPAVVQLGLQYADGSIKGAAARCLAMLHTFAQVIQDYSTPEGKILSRDLTHQLNTIINFLVDCRPLAVSMGNAIKLLKLRISQIDPGMSETEAKSRLLAHIQEYVHLRFVIAHQQLVSIAVQKVAHGEVIMTYAYSHVVAGALVEAAQQGTRFSVVVVDSRPEHEGKLMLQKLQAAGVPCTYAHFNALSYTIKDVSKVLLGAAAVLSNGTVMGRAGTAAVAMMAKAHSKPVLLCCESFKFHERVQLDSITHNELGDPDALVSVPGRKDVTALQGWQDTARLGLLNLKYDAMPAEFVDGIVMEHGVIPPTSVPVVLREYQQVLQQM